LLTEHQSILNLHIKNPNRMLRYQLLVRRDLSYADFYWRDASPFSIILSLFCNQCLVCFISIYSNHLCAI